MLNEEVARILDNIADILELKEVKFKPQAYRRAAQAIESLQEDVTLVVQRNELQNIPGIGKHIAAKIQEIVKTGKLKYYENLKKKTKIDIENLKAIPSLGPRKIKVLYKELRVKTVKDLEKVINSGKLAQLKGFGEKTAKLFLKGIEVVKKRPKRFQISRVKPIAQRVISNLSSLKEVKKIEIAGSFRRKRSSVKDLDVLVVSSKPEKVMDYFVNMKMVKDIVAKGKTKSVVRLGNGLQIDLRVVKLKEYGAALLYFTGSKEHNVALRKFALRKGMTLNEYGLFTLDEKKWVAGKSEKQIYTTLGLSYINPEKRLGRGEIVMAAKNS